MRTWLLTLMLTLFVSAGLAPAPAEADELMFVRVYSVADLVVRREQGGLRTTPEAAAPIEMAAGVATALGGRQAPEDELAWRNLLQLVDVIETITVPEDWEAADGEGRIAAYPEAFSLIVRQTAAGHEEVSDLLRQLRAEIDVSRHAPLEIKTYSVADLVIKPESRPELTIPLQDWTDQRVDATEEMERLVSFLRKTAPGDLWNDGASITPHITTHQLVVRQTPIGHQEIERLLSLLREPEDVVVRFQLLPIAFDERSSDLFDKINSIVDLTSMLNSLNVSQPLTPDEAERIAACLPEEVRTAIPELAIPNGHRRIEARTQCLRITPIVSPGRRLAKVIVDSFVDEAAERHLVTSRTEFDVQDGQSVLLHTYNDGAQRLWLIKAHIGDADGRVAKAAKIPGPGEHE